jgi:hypothetical protein
MANKKHVAQLKQGVEAWNQWRRENPKTRPNLSRADLIRASLSGADLRRTNLGKADLRRADLRGADLFGANLGGADLGHANLRGADLDYANLRGTGLSEADLTHSLRWLSGMKQPEAVERQKMGVGGVARPCGRIGTSNLAGLISRAPFF